MDAQRHSRKVTVTVYSGPNCHLCEVAKQRIESVRHEVGFEVEEISIVSDPDLSRRYATRIPVVCVEGEEVCIGRVSEKLLRRRILEALGRAEGSTPPSAGQPPGFIGLRSRLAGVLFCPGRVFSSVSRASSWVDWAVPSAIVAAVSSGIAYWIAPLALEDALGNDAAQMVWSLYPGWRTWMPAMTPAAYLLTLLALSGFFFGVCRLLGAGDIPISKVLAVSGYAGLVRGVEGLCLVPIIRVNATADLTVGPSLVIPQHLTHTWIYWIASGINLFTVWYLIVVSIGLGEVSGVPARKVGGVLFAAWLAYIGTRALVGYA